MALVFVCNVFVYLGQDDAGGTPSSFQDWNALSRRLMDEIANRTSLSIQSGKFTDLVIGFENMSRVLMICDFVPHLLWL